MGSTMQTSQEDCFHILCKDLFTKEENEWSVLSEIALRELGETREVRERCLHEMRLWLKHGGSHIKTSPKLRLEMASDEADKFLLRFLRAQKFDVKKAQKMLQRYLMLRAQKPEWFTKLDPQGDDNVRQLMRDGFITVLPKLDEEGRIMVLNWATIFDPTKHTKQDKVRCVMMTLEALACYEEVQIRGLSYIIYGENLTLSHAAVWSPTEAAGVIATCEKAIPLRHKRLSFVKLPFCLYALLEFVRLFVSAKIKSRTHMLTNLDTFSPHTVPLELTKVGQWSLHEATLPWMEAMQQKEAEMANIGTLAIDGHLLEDKSKRSLFWPF